MAIEVIISNVRPSSRDISFSEGRHPDNVDRSLNFLGYIGWVNSEFGEIDG